MNLDNVKVFVYEEYQVYIFIKSILPNQNRINPQPVLKSAVYAYEKVSV